MDQYDVEINVGMRERNLIEESCFDHATVHCRFRTEWRMINEN